MDTRVKLLVNSENLSYDEAVHLLQVCNWDVGKAQAVIAQRKLLQSPTDRGSETRRPLVAPAQGTSDPAPGTARPSSSHGAQNLPKSANMSKNPNEETPILRLNRGMSNAFINSNIVTEARGFLLKEAEAAMVAERGDDDDGNSFVQTTGFTFVLPDFSIFPEDLKAFLYRDLVDSATLVSLEQAGHLNWWADFGACQRLLPLVTSGDGNCLLHAASLGMWGFHDRQLTLRKLLHDALTNSSSAESFKRRWHCQQSSVYRQCGLVLSEAEWSSDWSYLLHLSSAQPRSVGTKQQRGSIPRLDHTVAGQSHSEASVYLESLEEIHVFVLSHILRRPIIVIAKTVLENVDGDALSPIPFSGIYLPLEWDSAHCHSDPLLLTYNLSHFSALVAMEDSSTNEESYASPPTAIPLVNPQLGFLPFHFAIDPGPEYDFSRNLDFSLSHDEQLKLLQRYLDVEQIPVPHFQRELDSHPEDVGTAGKTEQLADYEETGAKERNCGEDLDKRRARKFIRRPFDAVGSKLKNISRNSKVGKLDRRGSIGAATQSTRVSSVTTEAFEQHSFIVSAKLHHRKTKYHDEMTRNYVESMREKFSAQQIKRREQNVEIRRRSIERLTLRQSATSDALRSAAAAANEEETGVTGRSKLPTAITEEHRGMKVGDSVTSEGVPRRMNAITKRGISDRLTFDGNRLKTTTTTSKPSAQHMATDASTSSSHNSPISKNSPFPSSVVTNELKQDNVVGETGQRQLCKAGNCSFYGAVETDMLCSQCFKTGKQQRQQ